MTRPLRPPPPLIAWPLVEKLFCALPKCVHYARKVQKLEMKLLTLAVGVAVYRG